MTGSVARIRKTSPLLYDDGADPALDRPAHVRAASGIAWADTPDGPRLCLCQDDAHFLAILDPRTGRIGSIPLPAGPLGLRQFDKSRNNKMDKMDLESACVVATPAGPRLWLLGSGSAPVREAVIEVDLRGAGALGATSAVRTLSTSALCAQLRAHPALVGAELNLEGACVMGGELVLLQRGNGAGSKNAVVRVALPELRALLNGERSDGDAGALESLRVELLPLPETAGVPLTFTDGCALDADRVLFLAAAEASPNAIDDGLVVGAALGVLSLSPAPRVTALVPLVEADGRPSTRKPEGLALDPDRPGIAFVVVDMDDPAAASELLEVELPPDLRASGALAHS